MVYLSSLILKTAIAVRTTASHAIHNKIIVTAMRKQVVIWLRRADTKSILNAFKLYDCAVVRSKSIILGFRQRNFLHMIIT